MANLMYLSRRHTRPHRLYEVSPCETAESDTVISADAEEWDVWMYTLYRVVVCHHFAPSSAFEPSSPFDHPWVFRHRLIKQFQCRRQVVKEAGYRYVHLCITGEWVTRWKSGVRPVHHYNTRGTNAANGAFGASQS